MTARHGRERVAVELPVRFQEAIDSAAMRAGLVGSDAYLEEWRQVSRPCGDELHAEVAAEGARLEAAHGDDVLEGLVRTGGKADA